MARRQFLFLHLIAIATHTACFVYSIVSESGYDTPITTVLKRVSFAKSTDSTYYDVREAYTINLPSVVFIHGLVALITTLFHSLLYLPIHYKFSHLIWHQKYFTLRWVEYGLTCTLMTISSVLSSGTNDFNFLLTALFLGVALQLVGATVEQIKYQWKLLIVIGIFIDLGLSWSLVWYTLTSPNISNYQIIETLSFVFYYALFPLNCIADAVYRKNCFVRTDWTYNVLSLTSKFALFWLQVGEVERDTFGGIWPEVQIYGFGIALPCIVLIIGVWLSPPCVKLQESTGPINGTYWKTMRKIATFRLAATDARGQVTKKISNRR